MAKEKVQVKSYVRKDGTKVRQSSRAVMVVGEGKEKRQNTLRGHLKKGAKIGAGISGGIGALSGAVVGGAMGGPIGALGGATVYGASGALGGSFTGAGYGAGVYKARKMLAKDRSSRNFDYSMFIGDQELVEFKRGRDKKKRRRRQNTLSGHINKGVKIGAGLGAFGVLAGVAGAAATKNPGLLGANIITAPITVAGNAGKGAVLGAGLYGAKKLLAKDRSKRNFDYSSSQETIEFGRGKDKKKRQRKRTLVKNAAITAGVLGAGALALKNRKAFDMKGNAKLALRSGATKEGAKKFAKGRFLNAAEKSARVSAVGTTLGVGSYYGDKALENRKNKRKK